jgi:hypothetical protein
LVRALQLQRLGALQPRPARLPALPLAWVQASEPVLAW